MDSTELDQTIDAICTELAGITRVRSCNNENYVAGRHQHAFVPRQASTEFKALFEKSKANFIALVLRSLLQDLRITAYRHKSQTTAEKVWKEWVRQGMVSKHIMAMRHAAVHGYSFTALLPTPGPGGNRWTTGVFTPHEVYVRYIDEINDPRPEVFACRMPGRPDLAVVWMDKLCFTLDIKSKSIVGIGSTSAQLFGDTEPVVRYVAGDWIVSPSGRWATTGEVELLMSAQNRLTQAIMDLLLVQTFGAVAIRWIAGLQLPSDDADALEKKIELAADRFLTADDPETKFGRIEGTMLEPFIKNVAAALETFVMLSQSSPTRFMSKIENVGNDAILTAREPYEAKLGAYRENHGAQFELFSRAVAVAGGLGDPGVEGYFTWRSTELRTLAELMDAALKAASIDLNIEPMLRRNLTWGTEEQDELLDGYQRRREEGDPATRDLVASLSRQRQTPPGEPAQLPSGTQTGAGNPR